MSNARLCIDDYAGPMVKGIDVAHHQGTPNWDSVARSDYRYAIIRTGDIAARTGPEDRQFARNWREARRVGMRRGSYQYFRAFYGGAEQADLLVRQIEAAGGPLDTDIPPALDLEQAGQVTQDNQPLPIEQVLAESLIWLKRVEGTLGVRPIIYTGQYWHWQVSQKGLGAAFAPYPLWVPSYGTNCARMPTGSDGTPGPWSKWAFWQYSNQGQVPGIGTAVDLNYFRGSEAELAAFVTGSRTRVAYTLTPFGEAFFDWLRAASSR